MLNRNPHIDQLPDWVVRAAIKAADAAQPYLEALRVSWAEREEPTLTQIFEKYLSLAHTLLKDDDAVSVESSFLIVRRGESMDGSCLEFGVYNSTGYGYSE